MCLIVRSSNEIQLSHILLKIKRTLNEMRRRVDKETLERRSRVKEMRTQLCKKWPAGHSRVKVNKDSLAKLTVILNSHLPERDYISREELQNKFVK